MEKNVHESDDLHGLAQTHGVGQDAPKTQRRGKPRERFNDVVIQETNTTNLKRGELEGEEVGEMGRGG